MDMINAASSLEVTVLILCFLASGFFSGSEIVLMSLGIDRAKQILEAGGARSSAMAFMIEKPNELLATILVGNNIANVLAASLMTVIAARAYDSTAIAVATGVTTLFILIFGEVIPKTFARANAERLSVFVISVLRIKFYLFYPVIKSMVLLIKFVLGENAELNGRMITKNDIEYMINRAEQDKSMDSKQLDLLNSILEFPTIKVKDIMIPRLEVHSIQNNCTYKELLTVIDEEQYSRYPVCEGELDQCVGFLHVKDLAFLKRAERDNFQISKMLKEPFFVYEHMKIQAVFDYMNRKKVHLALVKDENGLVVGIVTLEDIIEEIVGEIQDEHDEEENEQAEEALNGNSQGITIEGSLSLRDLYSDYDIKIPLNDNYSTIAGFILDMLGNQFPEEGQIIFWQGFSFELMSVEEHEIKEVLVKDVDGENHIFSNKKDGQETKQDGQEVVPQNEEESHGILQKVES